MPQSFRLFICLPLLSSIVAFAQGKPSNSVIAISDPLIAIEHVSVIDGTGSLPSQDRLVIIKDGRIESIVPFSTSGVPSSAHVVDGQGKTLIPGLIGMHEHLFFPAPEPSSSFTTLSFSFPRLYLASGVTTARTTGSMEPYTDLNIKAAIDGGRLLVPSLS